MGVDQGLQSQFGCIYSSPLQVYDTPPSGRWQRPVPSGLGGGDDDEDEDGIYDTPRCVPPQADSETEVKITGCFAFIPGQRTNPEICLVLFNLLSHVRVKTVTWIDTCIPHKRLTFNNI